MGFYDRGTHADRASGGIAWKIFFFAAGLVALWIFLSFSLCAGREDRSGAKELLARAEQCESMADLDRLLLPRFEKEDKLHGRFVYTARPQRTGLCRCALSVLDALDVRVDGNGGVVEMSVYQTVDLGGLR